MRWQRFAVLLLVLSWLLFSAHLLSAQDGGPVAASSPIGSVLAPKASSTSSAKVSMSYADNMRKALDLIVSSRQELETLLEDIASSEKKYQAILSASDEREKALLEDLRQRNRISEQQSSTIQSLETGFKDLESRYVRDMVIAGGAGVVVGIVIATIYSVTH